MTMKWPPPPDQPIRAPTGLPARISARISSYDSVPVRTLTKFWVRVRARSKNQETLQAEGTGETQQVRPSSALAILHCVHVDRLKKYCETLFAVAAQHQFVCVCASMLNGSETV